MEALTAYERHQLKTALDNAGFELLEDRKEVLIEKIKNAIIEMVHNNDNEIKIKSSSYLSERIGYSYTYLSNLFSNVYGTTIEQFIISHKIERIKKLIAYGELNITEIAWKLNYNSVAHLSNQFKAVTGLSPSCFKKLKSKARIPIEEVKSSNEQSKYIFTYSIQSNKSQKQFKPILLRESSVY